MFFVFFSLGHLLIRAIRLFPGDEPHDRVSAPPDRPAYRTRRVYHQAHQGQTSFHLAKYTNTIRWSCKPTVNDIPPPILTINSHGLISQLVKNS